MSDLDKRRDAEMVRHDNQMATMILSELGCLKASLTDLHGVVKRIQEVAWSAPESAKLAIARSWYTTKEVSEILGKSNYTVREWCRLMRINARKRSTGRGDSVEWEISCVEVERYKNHGLLPKPDRY